MAEDKTNSDPAGRIRARIEGIERLLAEKAVLEADIAQAYADARAEGFDVKVLRKAIAHRAKDLGQRTEEDALLSLYLDAAAAR